MIEGRYVEIVAAIDAEFARNRRLHGDRMRCRAGCTDCCHHLFQITAIEAEHIGQGISQMDAERRETLRRRSRDYLEAHRTLAGDGPIAGKRLACPALEDGICTIYEYRPLICHKFGMPIVNPDRPGRVFACELNFQDGDEIDDPDLIQIQTGVDRRWKELQRAANRGAELSTVADAILETTAPG